MSPQDQDRADFEAWHLKVRGHVNADNACRKYLQEKDWETWQAARRNLPLVSELLEALERLADAYERLKPPGYPLSDREKQARAAIAKATGGAA